MALITINKASGSITGGYIRLRVPYIIGNGADGQFTTYAYKIAGTKGDFTFNGATTINTLLTAGGIAGEIGKIWRTGIAPADLVKLPNHYVATLKFSIGGVTYAAERILNAEKYQAATTTAAGFPAGAGKGAVNVGRFFGDPKNPRNYGIFTPDGRRIGN